MSSVNFDSWVESDSFAALVLREPLVPVDGPDGILFPPTYAPTEDKKFPGGYNIDHQGPEKNICLVDSVGSQSNRIEPIFSKEEYQALVPQVTIKAGEKSVNLLEAGHRAGDAIVRCTPLQKEIEAAFKAFLKGDAEPLAKIAPTSIVFGVWDSRNTQAKMPRVISSTIRAFDVKSLTRSAQYTPALDYVKENLLDDYEEEKSKKDLYSKQGFLNALSSASHGGVIATGGVRRDAILNLAAIRLLKAPTREKTLALRNYILGLSLVAFTTQGSTFLRQGCHLVPDLDKPRELVLVKADGTRESIPLTHQAALDFANAAAKAFGVGKNREAHFDKELAKADLTEDKKSKKKPQKGKKPEGTE